MPTKLVILEDEEDISEALSHTFTREGFRVWREPDGRRGLELIRQKAPNIVVLDLMLPGMDGMEVCRQIKSDHILKSTYVIIVTAKGDESDVLLGLALGADDYVTKPFKTSELVARAHAVLRRGQLREESEAAEVIRIRELVIDTPCHQVLVDGRSVPLTATEFRLLRFLASNAGRVFTRDQLLNQVIGDHAVVIDRNIDVHVRAIRRKLGSERDYIETIRGVGYRFIARD